jgi:hypothetical protein
MSIVYAPLDFFSCLVEENLLASMKTFPIVRKSRHYFSNHTSFTICRSILSSVHPSLDSGKIRVNLHVLCGFRSDISKQQAGSWKRFQGQIL